MAKRVMKMLALLTGMAVLFAGPGVVAQEFRKHVTKEGEIGGNVVAAGERVTIDAEVDGDVVTAGRDIVIGGRIADDILAAGRDVLIRGTVEGDVRAAGETVYPTGRIGGDLMAAARLITMPDDATVGGDAWLAAEEVIVRAPVAGTLRVAAREIYLAGDVGGDADLSGEEIVIAATARIAGDLTYRSTDDITIEPGAEILGDVIFVRSKHPRAWVGSILAGFATFALTFLVGMFALGVLLILAFPDAAGASVRRLARTPWVALGLGVAILIVGPIAITLLAASVVGIPLTIVLVAAYVIALFHGYLLGAGALGCWAARLIHRDADRSFWTRTAAFAAGLVVLSIVGFIPVLGALAVFLVTAAGLGAILLQMRRLRQEGPG